MTGPALLISIVAMLGLALFDPRGRSWQAFLGLALAWMVALGVVFGAARLLGGKGTYSATFRGVGFGSTAYLLALLALIPPLAPLARILALIVGFFGSWLGAAEANKIRGWRVIVLPITYVVLFVVIVAGVYVLLSGAKLSIDTLGRTVGLTP
jgi:hypothetical protein